MRLLKSTNNGKTNNTRGGHGLFGLLGQRGKETKFADRREERGSEFAWPYGFSGV